MAKRVRIASVQGNTAITADGERIEIIGNARVNSGSYVWTDGVVAYGYVPTGGEYKRTRKKLGGILPLYGYLDDSYLDDMLGVVIPAITGQPSGVTIPSYTIPMWKGKPTFLNDGKKFYSFRGGWDYPKLYATGKEQPYNISGHRLYLGNDDKGNWFWQTGNYCWQKSHMESVTYPKLEYQGREYDPDAGYYVEVYDKVTETFDADDNTKSGQAYEYPTYSLDNTDHNDLALVYGTLERDRDTISLQPIVDDILNTAKGMIKQLQETKPQGASPTSVPYYGGPPDPVLCEFALITKEGHNPPCDTNSSHGGSPLYIPNWRNINEYTNGGEDSTQAESVISAGYYSPYAGEYRVIQNPLKDGDVIQFMLTVTAEFQWFPYYMELDTTKHYRPAITAAGAYLWNTGWIDYEGSWLITVENGQVTKSEISRRFDGIQDYHSVIPASIRNQYTERACGGLTVQNTPDVNISSKWIRRIKKGSIVFPKSFQNIYAVVPYDKKTVFVYGELDWDDPDTDNAFVYVVGGTSATLKNAGDIGFSYDTVIRNDSYVFSEDYTKLKKLYTALENIPYVEQDS